MEQTRASDEQGRGTVDLKEEEQSARGSDPLPGSEGREKEGIAMEEQTRAGDEQERAPVDLREEEQQSEEDSAVGCLRSQGAPLQRIVPPVKLAKRIVLVALFWSPAFYEASSRGLEGGFKRGASTGAIAVEEKVVLLLLRRFVSNDDWELGEAEAGCEVPCRTQRVLWGDTGVRVLDF
ncbi:hypothetical protein BSKO_12626 [Bryopsis sp. KO-2023]|nr:hypothetical protein BSKO_12626 [Bryopsis sp. KO-2023]